MLSLIFIEKRILYTTSVMNKQGTNHNGEIKSKWWPVKKGIKSSFFNVIGNPQNLPIMGVIKIVIPRYKNEYKKYGNNNDFILR